MTSSRKIYRLTGPDARSFLQGLVTNDVEKIDQGLVYTALLTPQGKFLADFFLSADTDGGILLDIDATSAEATLKRLTMYRLRADVTIEESPLKVARGTGDMPEGGLIDPRHPALGWRLYGDTDQSDGTDWTALRVAHCIPETGIELTPDTFILEAGFEALNGVDFRKGCYVGQEVTARMKHKTELRKGLKTVEITGQAPIGSDIRAGEKTAGTLYSQSGAKAIAYLRFDRARGVLKAETAELRWNTNPD